MDDDGRLDPRNILVRIALEAEDLLTALRRTPRDDTERRRVLERAELLEVLAGVLVAELGGPAPAPPRPAATTPR